MQYERTPLIYASEIGHVAAVRLLLASGANINAEERVSTCECTVLVSRSLVFCLCACLCVRVYCIVGMYAVIVIRNIALIAIV